MYKVILVSLLAFAVGCTVPKDTRGPDQCLRRELFKECLALIPQGPEVVGTSNDWDETISRCSDAAYYQSIRGIEFIKPECRIE